MSVSVKSLVRILAIAAMAFSSLQVQAQSTSYPNRTVRIIVPAPPGGGTDAIARIVADRLGAQFGQQFIIENRGGGSTTIGSNVVAKAAPDGYTLLVTASTHVINDVMLPNLPYDSWKDFTHLTRLTSGPSVLVVNTNVTAKTATELAAQMKTRPERYNLGTDAVGSLGYMSMELYRNASGAKFEIVNYKGAGPALADIVGGHITGMFSSVVATRPHITAGKVRALGVTSAERVPSLPDVPTMVEQGFKNFIMTSWHGVYGPAGMPKEIQEKLVTAIKGIMSDPKVRERLTNEGFGPVSSSQEEFIEFEKNEYKLYRRLVDEGIVKLVQ
ncbi:MAG: tripartite tricarboxylate transporter substrate binding protein [Noviherbaspirillum sp.]|nr:tripartite tricarboxylate transporter substrate binding protein [Noviherbaspirillum sp.]